MGSKPNSFVNKHPVSPVSKKIHAVVHYGRKKTANAQKMNNFFSFGTFMCHEEQKYYFCKANRYYTLLFDIFKVI